MDANNFSPPTSGAPVPVWELSGWWRRVGALVIDSLLIGLPAFVLGAVLVIALSVDDLANITASDFTNMQYVASGITVVAAAIYYCLMMPATNGQTVGKQVTGIRVVREDGAQMNASFAFLRQILVIQVLFGWLGAFLLYVPTVLNYLWPLWDSGNQALHDKIVKSRVVIAESVGTAEPPPPVATGLVAPAPFPQAPSAAPAPPAPPAQPAPPAPPAPTGTAVPYEPPAQFENPVPEDEK